MKLVRAVLKVALTVIVELVLLRIGVSVVLRSSGFNGVNALSSGGGRVAED